MPPRFRPTSGSTARSTLVELVQVEREVEDVMLERVARSSVARRWRHGPIQQVAPHAACSVRAASRERLGRLVARAAAVLVEAVAQVGPRIPRPAMALERADRAPVHRSVRKVYGGWRISRALITAFGSSRSPGIQRDEGTAAGPARDWRRFMSYVIVRPPPIGGSSPCRRSTMPMLLAARGRMLVVGVEHDLVGRVLEAAEGGSLAQVGIGQQSEGVIGVGRHDRRRRTARRAIGRCGRAPPWRPRRTETTGTPARTASRGSGREDRST